MSTPRKRVTQQDIAKMTGVSQATVSLVLNGRSDADVRISPETRERVLKAIRSTGYVADPIARRLAARHNRILGVFTYEPVFPSGTADFYHPFLVGIEQCAESIGCDLLLLTSAPVVDGRRRIFHQDNRLRLADGCILLGRSLDPAELTRLVAEGQPFVSVGRRDDAGGPVPYVGVDYASATAALVRKAVGAGHTRLGYVGAGEGPESWVDRRAGFDAAAAAARVGGAHIPVAGRTVAEVLDAVRRAGVSAAFVEEYADAVALVNAARERGLDVPGDLSVLALGDPTRATETMDLTGYRIPRRAMGWQAVEVLSGLLEGSDAPAQRLLPCEPVEGATCAAPATT